MRKINYVGFGDSFESFCSNGLRGASPALELFSLRPERFWGGGGSSCGCFFPKSSTLAACVPPRALPW